MLQGYRYAYDIMTTGTPLRLQFLALSPQKASTQICQGMRYHRHKDVSSIHKGCTIQHPHQRCPASKCQIPPPAVVQQPKANTRYNNPPPASDRLTQRLVLFFQQRLLKLHQQH